MRAAYLPAIVALLGLAGCQTESTAPTATPAAAAARAAAVPPAMSIATSDVAQKCVAELARTSGSPATDVRASGIRLGQGGTTMVELELKGAPYLCRTDTAGKVTRVERQAPG